MLQSFFNDFVMKWSKNDQLLLKRRTIVVRYLEQKIDYAVYKLCLIQEEVNKTQDFELL